MKCKITRKNHFKALEFILFLATFYIACVLYIGNKNGFEDHLLGFFSIFMLISLLPVLHLHLEYYYYNRGVIFEINSYQKEINYTSKSGETETYNFDDLSKIVVYMAPSWHRKSSFQLLPFEQYHYARIFRKSGKVIIITCLMTQRVEDAMRSIKGVPLELKTRVYTCILFE
jgi:hypothetical protein